MTPVRSKGGNKSPGKTNFSVESSRSPVGELPVVKAYSSGRAARPPACFCGSPGSSKKCVEGVMKPFNYLRPKPVMISINIGHRAPNVERRTDSPVQRSTSPPFSRWCVLIVLTAGLYCRCAVAGEVYVCYVGGVFAQVGGINAKLGSYAFPPVGYWDFEPANAVLIITGPHGMAIL